LEMPRAILPPHGRLVALVLADHMKPDGSCYLTLPTIANEAGVARSTAWKYLDQIRRLGLLTWKQGGYSTANTYQACRPSVRLERTLDQDLASEDRDLGSENGVPSVRLGRTPTEEQKNRGGSANAARQPGELEDGANPCPGCGKVGALLVGDKTARCVRPECGWRWAG
jgi:helix-turn-helix protein